MARTIQLGERTVDFPSAHLQDIHELDSSALVEAKDWDTLRKRLEEDGFLYLKGAIKREKVLRARQLVLDALHAKGDVIQPGTDTLLLERCEAGCIPFMEGKNDLTHSKEVLDVLESEELKEITSGLLGCRAPGEGERPNGEGGSDGLLTLNYKWLRAVWRKAFTGAHVDRVYMCRGSPRLLTTWVPFSDCSLELGALAMCRGSHALPGFSKLQSTYAEVDTERDGLDGTGWFTNDPFEVSRMDPKCQWFCGDYLAGDVVLFGMRVFHMSTANTTDHVRISADVRWQPAADAADPRYIGDDLGQRERAGAWAKDAPAADGTEADAAAAAAAKAAAAEAARKQKVTMPELRRKWGFDPVV
jgi:hypothetical protein